MTDKQKVTYQDDDYGIEVFKKKDDKAKPEESKSKPQPDTLDEEALYEEKPKVQVGGQTQQTQQTLQTAKTESKQVVPADAEADIEDMY